MVSVLGVILAATTGSVAFRKLYEYYWKHPNVTKYLYADISSQYDTSKKEHISKEFVLSFREIKLFIYLFRNINNKITINL
jgi:hypothetical protein